MESIKGTETERIAKIFAGESQAKTAILLQSAIKDGYQQIAGIHKPPCRRSMPNILQILEGGMVEITASHPAGAAPRRKP